MGRHGVKGPAPFAYPARPHVRRHGPMGYSDYRKYLNWLRDEFSFRCAYCLRREAWFTLARDWQIDHFVPKAIRPEGKLDYDNLVYACAACNQTKATQFVPDPVQVAFGSCIEVLDDGSIRALNADGVTLIEALGLDDPDYRDFRKGILDLLEEVSVRSKSYQRILGYPKNLPDLSQEQHPPRGNKCPDGIRESCFERKKRGELPALY